jgi:hypothetical protein
MVEEIAGDGTHQLVARVVTGANVLGEVGALARDQKWPIIEIRVEHGRLDKVFRDITMSRPEPATGRPEPAAA